MNPHHSLEIGWHFGWPILHSHRVPQGRSDKTWKGRQEKHSLFGERKAQGRRPKRLESQMQNELFLKQIQQVPRQERVFTLINVAGTALLVLQILKHVVGSAFLTLISLEP